MLTSQNVPVGALEFSMSKFPVLLTSGSGTAHQFVRFPFHSNDVRVKIAATATMQRTTLCAQSTSQGESLEELCEPVCHI
jgi:hypothetical protein